MPIKQNVLDFKKKNDINLSLGSGNESTLSYTIGYAITNNIAINSQLHTMAENEGARRNNESVFANNEVILFKQINDFYPALNIGYGTGKLYRYTTDFDLRLRTMYLQPSFGYSNNYFDIGLSCKISNSNHQLKLFNTNSSVNYDFKDVGSKEFHFYEPAFTIGVGYKIIKLRLQTINIYQINSSKMNYIDNNVTISLNVNFNINSLLKKE